jgi:hypothetical protein
MRIFEMTVQNYRGWRAPVSWRPDRHALGRTRPVGGNRPRAADCRNLRNERSRSRRNSELTLVSDYVPRWPSTSRQGERGQTSDRTSQGEPLQEHGNDHLVGAAVHLRWPAPTSDAARRDSRSGRAGKDGDHGKGPSRHLGATKIAAARQVSRQRTVVRSVRRLLDRTPQR